MLAGEHPAGAAEAGLNLVGDQQDTLARAEIGHLPQIPVGRDEDAGFALDGFDQEGASAGSYGGFERLDVPERHADEARREGAEAVAVERFAGEAGDRGGADVKIVLAEDDLGFIAGDALDGVATVSYRLDGSVDGLCAGVHREHHLHAAGLGERLAEERQLVVAEGSGSEGYARSLV